MNLSENKGTSINPQIKGRGLNIQDNVIISLHLASIVMTFKNFYIGITSTTGSAKEMLRSIWSTPKDIEAKYYKIAARALDRKKDGIALTDREKMIVNRALSKLIRMKKTNVFHFLNKHF